MKLRYNFRLYPTPLQEHNMRQSAGNARWLWNFFLSENIRDYNQSKKFIFYNEMASILTELKQYNEWLNRSYSQVLQQTLKDLDLSLKFKKNNRGFPKFKCKWNSNDSFRYIQHTKIIGDKLRLPKIGDVKIKIHRDLPPHSSVTIYREVDKWYASFVVEVAEQTQISKDQIDSVIGIDVNANNIADSKGHLDQNPRCNRKYKKKLKRLQQSVSRKVKKSKNRAKAILRLKKFNNKLKNIKKDFLHKLSNRITKEAKLVCAETLDIEQMKKNHLSAIAIQDNGWASLFGLLEYKCKLSGHHFHQVNQYFPSSQTCFSCGNRKKMKISDRTYRCSCGWVCDRDINAALNIALYGAQEVLGLKSGQELAKVPSRNVLVEILSNRDRVSATQAKEAATSLESRQFTFQLMRSTH